MTLWTLSRITHNRLCPCGESRSWCACAHAHDRRWFIWLADRVFHRIDGPDHCKRSAEHYDPPVHFASADDGVTVHQGDTQITIPNSLRAALIREAAKDLV